jgi:hypothetical protein
MDKPLGPSGIMLADEVAFVTLLGETAGTIAWSRPAFWEGRERGRGQGGSAP